MLAFLRRHAHFPTIGDSHTARKQSYDEKYRFIGNDAGCDLRTGVCGHGRTEGAVLAQSDRSLRPASGTRLQCFRSGDGDADGRAHRAPLSWRTEIERLTFDVLDTALATSFKGIRTGACRPFLRRLREAAEKRAEFGTQPVATRNGESADDQWPLSLANAPLRTSPSKSWRE
jgi:hypothetical protein